MQAFNFKVPTEIVFGRGAGEQAAEKLMAYNAHRVFIVYGGGSVVKNGLLGKIEKSLQDAGLFTQAGRRLIYAGKRRCKTESAFELGARSGQGSHCL